MAAQTGELLTIPAQQVARQSGTGFPKLTALAASGVNPIPHYALACEDNTGTRHFWTDTVVSLTNAPLGFTYVAATLVIEGKS